MTTVEVDVSEHDKTEAVFTPPFGDKSEEQGKEGIYVISATGKDPTELSDSRME